MAIKKIIITILLLAISFPGIISFLKPGFPTTHDGHAHLARFASFEQALADGQFPPRWANLAWGYGSPVLTFNFSLPYWMAFFFRQFKLSYYDSFKAVIILSHFVSVFGMYFFLKTLTHKTWPALVGAVLYVWVPYRYLDYYVRGEIGEIVFFALAPLFLWSAYKQKIILIILTTFLLLLAHQALAGVLLASSTFFFIVNYWSWQKTKTILLGVILGLLLTSYNLFPLLFERQYTNLNHFIATNYQNQFPTIKTMLYSKWSWGAAMPENPDLSMSFQFGVAQWLVVVCALLLLSLKRHRTMLVVTLILVGLLFLVTQPAKFIYDNISILQALLFPWRLYGVAIIFVSILCSLLLSSLKKPIITVLFGFVLIVVAVIGNRHHLGYVGREYHNDDYYQTYPYITDIWGEFLPVWADLKKLDQYKYNRGLIPSSKISVDQGQAEIESLSWKTNDVVVLGTFTQDSLLTLNHHYFPGWEVTIDKYPISITPQELIIFPITKGQHQIDLHFDTTPIRRFGDSLSLGIIILIMTVIIYKLLPKK